MVCPAGFCKAYTALHGITYTIYGLGVGGPCLLIARGIAQGDAGDRQVACCFRSSVRGG